MQVNQRIWLVIIAVIAVGFGCIHLSLSLPKTTGQWQPLESSIYYQATPDAKPSRVEHFIVDGEKLPADTNFLIDEPDLLDFLSDYYQLLKNVGALTTALQQGTLIVQTADAAITLLPQQRNLSELPFLFWLQWFCGVLALLLTLLIWATRPATLVIRLFVLTGIGYAASILAASVYSTRELFIAAELWRALSLTNHAGALLFIAAMPSLLWVYPLRLPAWRWLIAFFFAAAALSLTAGLLHWLDRFSLILHSWTLVLFAGGFVGALWQWWLTRFKPKERAVLIWLQLSVLVGMVLFTSLTLIPVAMNEPPLAQQAWLLAAMLLLYLGIALGVLRFRLFDIERWSIRLWAWSIGGLAVIAVDFLLVSLMSWHGPTSLAASAAIVGWLYFPLRQLWWRRVRGNKSALHQDWLAKALPLLVPANLAELPQAFATACQAIFAPLEMHYEECQVDSVSIHQQGEKLIIPLEQQQLELSHAASGRRLFNRDDVRAGEYIILLQELVRQAIVARELGGREERERIQQDMHDDLGANLLTLLHQVPETQQPLVRASIQEMRQLLRALDRQSEAISKVLERCRLECLDRCAGKNVQLEWRQTIDDGQMKLSSATVGQLERMMREATTNALKHSEPAWIKVSLQLYQGTLQGDIVNDGCLAEQVKPQRGLRIMQKRAEQLEGSLQWQAKPPEWRLSFSLRLQP